MVGDYSASGSGKAFKGVVGTILAAAISRRAMTISLLSPFTKTGAPGNLAHPLGRQVNQAEASRYLFQAILNSNPGHRWSPLGLVAGNSEPAASYPRVTEKISFFADFVKGAAQSPLPQPAGHPGWQG